LPNGLKNKNSEGKTLPKLAFQGKVVSGTGKGKCFIDLPWVRRQIEDGIGFSPYSGTLNLHLTGKNIENKSVLENAKGIMVVPQVGYYPGMLFKAEIGSLKCAVVVPLVPSYPKNLLEVIATIHLRGSLSLTDGDDVTVTVYF
jgi:riboflavin kinase